MQFLQRHLIASVATRLALELIESLDEVPANGLIAASTFGTDRAVMTTFGVEHEDLLA